MRGWIYVHTKEEYDKWAAANLTAGTAVPPEDGKSEKKAESTTEGKPKS
jgi:heme/copper-type cytochrome/quinol oxidase subunit 2